MCVAEVPLNVGGGGEMWMRCPDGIFRLDCVLENGVARSKAELKPRGSEYRLSIEGFGSFREPKTLKEVNVILARHDLWPFRETGDRCLEYFTCLPRTTASSPDSGRGARNVTELTI